jgi:predicted nucleic acid-binding protein
MTICCDATALILLSKVNVLELLVKKKKVITTYRVYEEVIKGKEKGRLDSYVVEKLVHENKVTIKNPSSTAQSTITKLFNLKAGELSVISLAYNTQYTVLTDDRKCLNAARTLGIPYVTSLSVIVLLCKKKVITKEKARVYLDSVEDYGWYSTVLIKLMKEELQ